MPAHTPLSHIKGYYARWRARRHLRRALQYSTTTALLWLLVAHVILTTPASASLIAASKIQYCRRDGSSDPSEPADCTRKMVVTLTIDSGQLAGVEDVVFINSASDETDTSTPTVQFQALRLSTSRTPVVYRYPLFYTHNYNAKPFEENIGGTLLKQCNADFNAKTATCGISTDSNLQMVPYSQGFCCDCGVCATLGLCEADWRASNACNLFQTYTTASCLRFAELWYSAYTIAPMQTSYTITLTFSTNTTDATSDSTITVVATLTLSPQTPEDSSTSPGVLARLIGDFVSSEQPWDFTSRMLFVPSMPRTHERCAAGVAEYMLLPITDVTTDGRTCNKVGVSYEAFASQGNACRLAKGSCLAAQLEDKRTSDMAAVAAGRAPTYLVSGFGDFFVEKLTDASTGTMSPYLSYQATAAGTSMITVTLNADDLEFVVSISPGRLLSVRMNLQVIDASTKDGVLRVDVENTGTLSSRYIVAVPTCTAGIFPITAQTVYLSPQEIRNLTFSVLVQDINLDTNNATCNVTLRNEQGVLDSSSVTFGVNKTIIDNGPQGGGGGGGDGTAQDGNSTSTSCSSCSFIDFKCTFGNICVGLIVGQLAVILAIVAALAFIIKFRRCLCCCLPCFSSSSSGGSGGGGGNRHRRRHNSCSSVEDVVRTRAHRHSKRAQSAPYSSRALSPTKAGSVPLKSSAGYYACPSTPPPMTSYAMGYTANEPLRMSFAAPPMWPEMYHEPYGHEEEYLYTVAQPAYASPDGAAYYAPSSPTSRMAYDGDGYVLPPVPNYHDTLYQEMVSDGLYTYVDEREVTAAGVGAAPFMAPTHAPYGYMSTAGFEETAPVMSQFGVNARRRRSSGAGRRAPDVDDDASSRAPWRPLSLDGMSDSLLNTARGWHGGGGDTDRID